MSLISITTSKLLRSSYARVDFLCFVNAKRPRETKRAKRIRNYDLLLLLLSPALVKKSFFVVILLTLTNSEIKKSEMKDCDHRAGRARQKKTT